MANKNQFKLKYEIYFQYEFIKVFTFFFKTLIFKYYTLKVLRLLVKEKDHAVLIFVN